MVECESHKFYLCLCDEDGFNRYMVECEFSVRVFLFVPASGFNRYMVECEYIIREINTLDFEFLIDTWWNVNFI